MKSNLYLRKIIYSILFFLTSLSVFAQPVAMPHNTGPVCLGDSLELHGYTLNIIGTPTYEWTYPDKITKVSTQHKFITPTESGYYTLKITATNGTDIDSTFVIVNDRPQISIIGLSPNYCNNIAIDSITVSPLYGIVYDNDILQASDVASTWLFKPSQVTIGDHDIKYVKGAAIDNPVTIFEDDFSKDKGWQGYDGVTKIWERAAAKTGTACTAGSTDPSTDHTAGVSDNYVIGNIIGGCYPLNQPSTKWLESPVIDCSNRKEVQLTYFTWNKVGAGDSIFLEAWNGTKWISKIKSAKSVNETSWNTVNQLLPEADENASFKIRLGFRPTTGLQAYPGMTIDDVRIYGIAPNDCSDSTELTTTIYPVPVVDAGTDQEICKGFSATLSATSDISVSWAWSNGAFVNPIIVAPTTTTVYTVTGTAAGSCSASDRVTVTVNQLPTATITPISPISLCNGSCVTLTATGGSSYNWNNGSVTATNQVCPTGNTTYTVSITDSKACSATNTAVVTVNLSPTANADTDRPICKGASTSLTASYTGGTPGGTYMWSSGGNTAIITVSPVTTSTYTVTVSLPNGCTSSDNVIVTVNNLPTVSAGADDTICFGSATTLTATGANTYIWTSPAFTPTTVVSPIAKTTYTVTGTDINLCTNIDAVVVFVNNKPTATITPSPTTICSGSSVTLTASGGLLYAWNNGNLVATNTVNPILSTTYTVSITDANGCTNTTTVAVTVNPNGTANAGADTETCKGSAASLTATYSGGIPSGTYLWNTNEATATISVTPLVNTTYTVTVTLPLPNGCTSKDEVVVTVNNLPTADAGPDKTICLGSSTTLSANGGISFIWSNGALTQTTVVIPITTTTYSVSVRDLKSCTNTDFVVITPQALPVASVTNASVCKGFSQTITASGGTNYSWNTLETTAAITDDPLVTTIYTVTIIDALGCTDSENGVITVLPDAPLTTSGDMTICPTSTANLLASGCNSYSWNTGGTTPGISVNPILSTTYTVTGTDLSGCTASENVIVSIGSNLVPGTIADRTICKGSSTTLIASPGPIYTWSNNGETVSSISVSPVVKTTYTVTVNDGISCTGTTSVVVSVAAIPTATIASSANPICSGTNINLTASPAGQAYVWNIGTPVRINTQTPLVTTTYSVTVTENTNNCTDDTSIVITVITTPTVTALSDVTICTGGSTTLSSSLSGGTYSWSSGETTQSITKSPLTTTNYTLTYTKNGCSASDNAVITVAAALIPDAGPATPICLGSSTQLQATGGTTFTWAASASLTATNISNPIATPAVTTTYTVTVNDGICTGTDNVIITVYAYPTVDAGTNTTICKGNTTTINGSVSGAISSPYKWISGQTTQSISVTPLVTTTYTLTATNNGCSTSDNVTITVNPLPTVIGINDTICSIHGGYIKATGADTYVWDTGETTDSVYKHPIASTTYTVTGTINGCTASANAAIIVNQTPTVDAGADTVVCKNATASLSLKTEITSSGQKNYEWSTGETTSAINKTPLTTTIYYVTLTDPTCGCTNKDTIVVIVNPLPTAFAGGNQQLCNGKTVDLNGSGGQDYLWSTNATTATITVFPITTNTYTLTVTDANGCTGTAKSIVTVNALPTADAGSATEICESKSANLTATGGATYSWSDLQSTSIISVNPASTTTYTITVTNAALCTASDNVIVTVNTNPTVNLGLDAGICLGGSSILSPTIIGGDGNNIFKWAPGGATSTTLTVNPIIKTTYSLTVTDGKGCKGSDNIVIDIVTELHPNLGPDTSVCKGSSLTLNCSGYANYEWNPSTYLDDNLIANPTCTPTNSITYTISVNDGGGCSGTDDIIVTVNPVPIASATPSDTSVCRGFPINISASGGATYLWNDAQTLSTISVTPQLSNTYIVSVYNVFNCYDTASVSVHVFPDPPANGGSDTAICPGNTITLTATGGGKFLWSDAGKTTASINVNPIIPTIYYVTVTNLITGCTDFDSVIVSMNPVPTAIINGDVKICAGKTALLVATGGESYAWNTSSSNDSITTSPIITTKYTVTALNNFGCFDTDTWTVAVDSTPTAFAGIDKSFCDGKSITFTASGGTNYSWSTGDVIASTTVSPIVSTTYIVTVSYNNGCTSTDDVVGLMNTNPSIDLGNNITICLGASASLNPITSGGDSNYSFLWDNSTSASTRTVTPIATTTYSVLLTDGKGCSDSDNIIVIIGPTLLPSVTNDTTLCKGSCIQLQASGGLNYTWSNGLGTSSNPTACPLITTTYTVSVNDGGNCSGTGDVVITINQGPTVIATADTPAFCNGGSTDITATGGIDYEWSTTETIASIHVIPTSTQTYTVTATNNVGCTNKDEVIVTVNANPIIDLGTDIGVCTNGSTLIIAEPTSGDGNYTYIWSNSKTDSAFVYSPLDSITFIVTVTDGNGCTDSDNIRVYIDSILRITITPDTSICLNSSIQLNVIGGVNFNWSPALGLSSTTVSNPIATPLVKTTYIVHANDGGTCSATDSIVVSIYALPIAEAGVGATVCNGVSVPLIASGGIAYAWSDGTANAITSVAPATTSTYTVTVFDINLCSDDDQVVVNINPNPTVDLGSDVGVCKNGSSNISLTTSGGSGGNSILWNTLATTTTIAVGPVISDDTYTVLVTDKNGCSDTDDILVYISTKLDISINDTFACTNNCVQLLLNGGKNYTWSPTTYLNFSNIQNPIACPLSDITYTVSVNDGATCTATATIVVSINPLPTVDAGTEVALCEGETANLTASSNGSYSWSTGEITPNIAVTPGTTQWYNVTATSAFGCTSKDSVRVNVNPNPLINLGNDIGVCKDGSTIIKANPTSGDSNYNFIWSNTNTTSSFTFSPIDSINPFTVTVTDGKGCSNTDDIVVFIDSVLSITVTPNTSVCLNNCIQLAVNGGMTYTWSPALGISDINSQTPMACPLVETSYIVEARDGKCSALDTVVVTINQLPIADAGTGATICKGLTVPLMASGGITYAWNEGTLIANTSVSPTSTTTYTVTATDVNLCTDDDQVIVFVNPNPTVDLGKDVGICKDGYADISLSSNGGSGGDQYLWSNGNKTTTISLGPITTDNTYSVTVTDIKGCSDTDAILVFISQKLDISIRDTFACSDNCVQLLLNGGKNYKWSPTTYLSDSTINNPIACPPSKITYTVNVDDGGNCTASTTVVVSINPTPTVDANDDVTLCQGDIANITAQSNGTYLWTTGETQALITVSPFITTWYKVIATNVFGCTEKDSLLVKVNPVPIVSMGENVGVCKDGSTVIHAQTTSGDGTYSFLWNDNSTLQDIVVTPTDSITFTVTVTDGNTCTATDDIIVYIDSVLRVQATPDTSICFLSMLQLYVNGGLNYTWTPSISLSETDVQSPLAGPLTNTTYIVTVNDGGKCTAADTVIVSLNPIPTANAGIGNKICEGISVSLQASGGTSYTWDNSITNAITIVTPSITTTYTVTVENNFNCSDKDEVVIIVNSNPTVSAGPDIGICTDGSTKITISSSGGSGSNEFLWSNGNTETEFIVSPKSQTTYTATVTDINGCSDSDDLVVSIGNALVISLPKDTSVCLNSCVQLLVNGGVNYLWSPPVNLSDIHIQNPISCPTQKITYIVNVNDGGNCSAVDSIVVSINPVPTVDVNTSKSIGRTICKGNSTTLHAIGGTDYYWDTQQTTPTIGVSPVATTLYRVTVTNNQGCTEKDSITITVNDLPVVSLGPNAGICKDGSTNLTANMIEGKSPYNFLWNTTQTQQSITVSPSIRTTYATTVTDANSCSNSDEVIIYIGTQLQPNAGSDIDICQHDSVQLSVNGGLTYIWSPGATLSSTIVQNPFAKPLATTTYIVTASEDNICTGLDTVIVTVNALPTPNAGVNQKICLGSSVTLEVKDGLLYEWSTGKTKATIIEIPDTSTTYFVTATNVFGCTNNDSVFVRVSMPVADLGTNKVICGGGSVTIAAKENPVNKTYLWNTTETTTSITKNPLGNSNYTITVTDTIGCTDTDEIAIIIQVTPQPQLISSNNKIHYCYDEAPMLYLDNNYYSYLWSTGSTTDHINFNQTDYYSVTVKDSLGCVLHAGPNYLTVDSVPIAQISYNQSKNLTYVFKNYSMSGVTYTWDFGDQTSINTPLPTHTYSTGGKYLVKLTASNDCSTSKDSLWITVKDSISYGVRDNVIGEIMSIYPNPTKDQFTIKMQTSITENAVITVYNMMGAEIHSENISLISGEQKINLSLSNQAMGIYTIQIKSNNNVMNARVMKD